MHPNLAAMHASGMSRPSSAISPQNAHPEPSYPANPARHPTTTPQLPSLSRRALIATACALAAAPLPAALAAPSIAQPSLDIERAAAEAYSQRDFASAVRSLNELVSRDPTSPRLREMRAMALVDGKAFTEALKEFDECLRLLGSEPTLDRARVLSGRALAWEGISEWPAALDDYSAALSIAQSLGADPDPYILNSRGNCHASLGEWAAARADYLLSADGFQTARREDRLAGRLQQRLDGAVFAFSNAALMLAQLGDDDGATKEMQSIARRAPGSADMRAALAAQFWAAGQEDEAEGAWDFACSNITVGCSKYQDEEWLRTIRRWPPVMIERLEAFLKLRSTAEGGGEGLKEGQRARPRRYSGFKE